MCLVYLSILECQQFPAVDHELSTWRTLGSFPKVFYAIFPHYYYLTFMDCMSFHCIPKKNVCHSLCAYARILTYHIITYVACGGVLLVPIIKRWITKFQSRLHRATSEIYA